MPLNLPTPDPERDVWGQQLNDALTALDEGKASLGADGLLPESQVPERLTESALAGEFVQVVHRPVNVAQKYGRDDAAVRAAVAEAEPKGAALHFAGGDFTLNGDLTLDQRIDIAGDGYTSRLLFTDGGLILDGTAAYLLHPTLRDLRIRRVGTLAGPALHIKGASTGLAPARLTAYNLHLSSPAYAGSDGSSGGAANTLNAGDALLYEGAYLGYFYGCYFQESKYGIRGITAGGSGVNALCFYGGESNGNQYGWDFTQGSGISFYGFTTEGNYARGGRIAGLTRGFGYNGGYFELNAGPDIEVDCNAGGGGILIEGNAFHCAGAAKTESILLRRGRVGITDNHFNGLVEADGDVAIRVDEGTSPVSGYERNNMREDDGTIVAYTSGGAAFNVTQLGQVTKRGSTVLSSVLNEQAGITFVRRVRESVDFPSIPANSEATVTVTVAGAEVGDDCSVSTLSILEAGLSLRSWAVTAPDTVSISLRNNTAAPIDPIARSVLVRVWR